MFRSHSQLVTGIVQRPSFKSVYTYIMCFIVVLFSLVEHVLVCVQDLFVHIFV